MCIAPVLDSERSAKGYFIRVSFIIDSLTGAAFPFCYIFFKFNLVTRRPCPVTVSFSAWS